jgi:hypothetical protein
MQTEVDMTGYDKQSPAGDPRDADPKKDSDSIIPGRHGKHGGGLESEGRRRSSRRRQTSRASTMAQIE